MITASRRCLCAARGTDDIIIEVECCGICAADVKVYEGAPSSWGDKDQPACIEVPMIPGP